MFNNLSLYQLFELAAQARIDCYQSRSDIIEELEEDYWKSLYDAITEHSNRGFDRLDNMVYRYFDSSIQAKRKARIN